jgi:ubiquinone/menaquinone biosynthesis C-methylase UbiE
MKKQDPQQSWTTEASDQLFEYGYQGVVGWLQNLGHKKIYQWLKNSNPGVFVDLGIGQGSQFFDPDFNPERLYRSDLDLHNLLIFKQQHPESKLLALNAENLPIKSNSIDHILSIYMLEHIPDLEASLREIHRVLKSTGNVYIALPAEGGFLYKLGRELTTKRYIEKKFDIDYDAVIKTHHLHNYPEIAEMIMRQFIIKRMSYLPFGFFPIYHLNAFICLRAEKSDAKGDHLSRR